MTLVCPREERRRQLKKNTKVLPCAGLPEWLDLHINFSRIWQQTLTPKQNSEFTGL